MTPIPVLIAWDAVGGVFRRAWTLWAGLPGPIKAAVLIAVALLVGELHGRHVGDLRCEARIAASVKAAETRDAVISSEAHERAQRQTGEADARSAAVKSEVRDYVEELAKRTAAACSVGADADRFNSGLGVQDDGLQPPRPIAPGGSGHRTVPRLVPPSTGQR